MSPKDARKIVFDAKPLFADLFEKYKDRKWTNYIEENYPKNFVQNDHIGELLGVVSNILSPLLGEESAKSAIETIVKTGFVSTADHSGVLCHPFFLNSNLLRSENIKKNESIVSFTCGGVSLTNSSYPRGVFFHDRDLKQVRIPFVSLAGRRRSVYGLSSFSKDRVKSVSDSIQCFNISEVAKRKLRNFFTAILSHEKIFKLKKYSDQLTILNGLLWSQIFGDNRGNLIYIEVENIIRKLLLNVHLAQKTLINKIIFDEKIRGVYIENSEKIAGAHNTKENSGSHIFWFIDEKNNYRVQMFLRKNSLESIDKKIKINFIESELRLHLENYTLLPSMAFCYGILAGYYGLTLGGGFSQIKYLGDILEVWRKTAETAGEKAETPRTDVFSGEFVLAGLSDGRKTVPASFIDVMLYSADPEIDYPNSAKGAIDRAIAEMTVGETIDAMMDEFVKIITTKKEKVDGVKINKTFFVE